MHVNCDLDVIRNSPSYKRFARFMPYTNSTRSYDILRTELIYLSACISMVQTHLSLFSRHSSYAERMEPKLNSYIVLFHDILWEFECNKDIYAITL